MAWSFKTAFDDLKAAVTPTAKAKVVREINKWESDAIRGIPSGLSEQEKATALHLIKAQADQYRRNVEQLD